MDMTGGIDGPSGAGGVDPQDRASGPDEANRAGGPERVEGADLGTFVDGVSGASGLDAAAAMGAITGADLERLSGRIQERLSAGDSHAEVLENLVRSELEASQGSDRATQFVMEKVQEDPALSELFETLVRHVEGQSSKGNG